MGRGWALWGVMALTILLPNFLFYSTNIRMYALLFAASLAFLWTAFRLLESGGDKGRLLAWHGLTALLCALVDWHGLLLVGLTWGALITLQRRAPWARRRWSGPLLAAVGGLALVVAVLLRQPILLLIQKWPSTQAAPGAFSLATGAKWLFLQIRPVLDLVYPPDYPLALNLLLWGLLALALPVAAVVLWRGGEGKERLVVVLALSWLMGSSLGMAVTRAFLPAQFFMLLGLALALQRLRRRPSASAVGPWRPPCASTPASPTPPSPGMPWPPRAPATSPRSPSPGTPSMPSRWSGLPARCSLEARSCASWL